MSSRGAVGLAVDNGVADVTLQRPDKLNALTLAMLAELEHVIESLEAHSNIRALTITGQGRTFSVGADLEQFGAQTPETVRRQWIAAGHRVFNRLVAFPRPTLAVVNGHAFGGGLELALACDLRVAAATATLGQPEVGVGTVPGWGGTARLVAAVGAPRARELVLTGRHLDADTACAWGLLNAVAHPDDLPALRADLLERLCEPSAVAQELAKTVLNGLIGDAPPALALEALAGSLSATTDDLDEGIDAFRSKRPPEFKGR